MTTFDKREEGFEKKFAIDEDLKFRAEARRNRLLGLWVAEKLGIVGDAAALGAHDLPAAPTLDEGPVQHPQVALVLLQPVQEQAAWRVSLINVIPSRAGFLCVLLNVFVF